MIRNPGWRWLCPVALLALLLCLSAPNSPASAQAGGSETVPGGTLGSASDAEMWRAIRRGVKGNVSIPDQKAATLVQIEGDSFRAFRNGPLASVGGWALLATVVVLAAFLTLRGRIRVDPGLSGRTVLRFNAVERFAHWLTAGSFIVLSLTGLNILYGKFVLVPLIGQSAFAALTYYGKLAHDYLGFAFIAGVLLMLVIWIRHNLPNRHDVVWLLKGGGLLVKGVHPPAKKFNAGQKLIFWVVVIGGLSLGVSGVSLMFPFEFALFSATFEVLNMVGFSLPTDLSPLQETQLALLWHGVLALGMMVIIIAHIYIGSIGMEGAIEAVTTGQVDENWAREHHALWLDEAAASGPDTASGD
ncbi:MAG: formate dehydrogenase subunit gamma [Alphaproteobacteria bacterium]|jgi:formate dehydrogenase subunit gamma|nr:formate dehydrogenase subunit gamma [Alphaproteobacteria bacterium]